MTNKILALSGCKQSGKNTAFNYLLGLMMGNLGIVRGKFAISDDGKLWVEDIFGDEKHQGIFDIERTNNEMLDFLDECIYPYIKSYSFADNLKRDICMNILGLSFHHCYGTDEDKNEETHLNWQNMPGIITEKGIWDLLNTREVRARMGQSNLNKVKNKIQYHPSGPMTAREVMQYVGTDIFRKIYGNVWAESCIRKIQSESPLLAVITDCRFPNEVEVVQAAGGKVIRLTRGMKSSKDAHPSETILNPDVYDWNNFDAVLDNAGSEGTIGAQNTMLFQILQQWGWIDPERKLS